MVFINRRKRHFTILNFCTNHNDRKNIRQLKQKCFPDPNKTYFQQPIGLYCNPGKLHKYIVKGKGYKKFYPNLHSYIKAEKSDDLKFVQNILRCLPKSFMQRYFQERNDDPDFRLTNLSPSPEATNSYEKILQQAREIKSLKRHSEIMIQLTNQQRGL